MDADTVKESIIPCNIVILACKHTGQLGIFHDTHKVIIRNSNDIPRGVNVEMFITYPDLHLNDGELIYNDNLQRITTMSGYLPNARNNGWVKIITKVKEIGENLPEIDEPTKESLIKLVNDGISSVGLEFTCEICESYGWINSCRDSCNGRFLKPKVDGNNNLVMI